MKEIIEKLNLKLVVSVLLGAFILLGVSGIFTMYNAVNTIAGSVFAPGLFWVLLLAIIFLPLLSLALEVWAFVLVLKNRLKGYLLATIISTIYLLIGVIGVLFSLYLPAELQQSGALYVLLGGVVFHGILAGASFTAYQKFPKEPVSEEKKKKRLNWIYGSIVAVVILIAVLFSLPSKPEQKSVYTGLPQIELGDLPAGFSIEDAEESFTEKGSIKNATYTNIDFEKRDLSSYESVKDWEAISYQIMYYDDEKDILADWRQAIDTVNESESIPVEFEEDRRFGDDQVAYMYEKPMGVEGRPLLAIGIHFRIDNAIVSISDSGFDGELLENRVASLSQVMEARVKSYQASLSISD